MGHSVYILLVYFVHFVVYSALIVGGCVVLTWSRKSSLGPTEIIYMCDGPIETVECIWVNLVHA